MQAYIITETEKQNFLKELELEKLKSPNAMDAPLEMTPAEGKATQTSGWSKFTAGFTTWLVAFYRENYP